MACYDMFGAVQPPYAGEPLFGVFWRLGSCCCHFVWCNVFDAAVGVCVPQVPKETNQCNDRYIFNLEASEAKKRISESEAEVKISLIGK